jgi:phosphomannomutase
MALILHLLAESGQTVSQILSTIPSYRIVKERLACPSYKINEVLKMLRHDYSGYEMDTRDGVKVMLNDGWFLVRGSNTEPIIRVAAEAETEERAREIVMMVFEQVRACVVS